MQCCGPSAEVMLQVAQAATQATIGNDPSPPVGAAIRDAATISHTAKHVPWVCPSQHGLPPAGRHTNPSAHSADEAHGPAAQKSPRSR